MEKSNESQSFQRIGSHSSRSQTGPRKRQKIAIACDTCRNRKIRCDGKKPSCGNCLRKQDPSNPCTYIIDHGNPASEKGYIQRLHERIRELENERAAERAEVQSPPQDVPQPVLPPIEPIIPATQTFPPLRPSIEVDKTQRQISPRMIRPPPPPQRSTSQGQFMILPPVPENSTAIAPVSAPLQTSTLQNVVDPEISDRSKEGSPFCDSAVSAMGAASHVSDRVTAARELFYGNSSAVSFQNQVRETIRRYTGDTYTSRPSPPSLKPRKREIHRLSDVLENVSGTKMEELSLPPRPLADHLLDLYWNRVHCLYPFVHKPSFLRAYEQLWSRENVDEDEDPDARPGVGLGGSNSGPSTFYCALNGMFALGCQFSDIPPKEMETLSDSFFRRSKHFLHIDILDEGDLALVQTLLIMGQYLQSTHYPDRCWNIVGLACRVAQGIGLYLDEANENRSTLEVEMRRRAWYGCVLLDITVSMTLGRPPITSGQSDVPLPMAVNDDSLDSMSPGDLQNDINPPLVAFFVQGIKLCKILAEILTDVYKPWSEVMGRNQIRQQLRNNSFDTIIKLDCSLSDFEAAIPNQLHWSRRDKILGCTEIVERQVNVLHARCTHLRLLLYRPIFNQLCIESKLINPGKASGDTDRHDSANNMLYSHFAPYCAAACVEAAQDLINIIDHSSQTTSTGAWWYNVFYLFSSGMVLVLAETCPTILEPGKQASVRDSWDQCQNALERISHRSHAAKQCARTLRGMYKQARPKGDTQRTGKPQTCFDPITSASAETRPPTIDSGVYMHEQTTPVPPIGTSDFMESDFLFQDYQPLRDMLSIQNAGFAPWNLGDDLGWSNMLTQDYSVNS